MSPVIWLIIAGALMPAAGYALIGGLLAARWLVERRRTAPPPEPLDRLAASLRRLRSELDTAETSDGLTAKRHHVASARGAYLDTITQACRRLGAAPPPGAGASQADIYRAEAALAARGLDVRTPVC